LFQFDAGMTSANPKTGTPGTNATSGNGMASFLLGYGNNGSTTEPAQTADQNVYGAIYLGDTFQVARNLTLNLGIRADLHLSVRTVGYRAERNRLEPKRRLSWGSHDPEPQRSKGDWQRCNSPVYQRRGSLPNYGDGG